MKTTERVKLAWKALTESNNVLSATILGNDILRSGKGGASAYNSQQIYVSTGTSTAAGRSWGLDEASQNATIRTCLDFQARTIAQLPIKIRWLDEKTGEKYDIYDKRVPSTERTKAKELMKLFNSPNNYQTRYSFIWQMSAWMGITGEAFVFLYRDKPKSITSTPAEMYVLDSSLMTSQISSTRYPLYRISSAVNFPFLNNNQELQHYQVMHLMDSPFQGGSGWNRVTQAVELLALDEDIDVLANYYMTNAAKPSGIFTTEQEIPEDLRKEIEERIKVALARLTNNTGEKSTAGQALLLGQGMKFEVLDPPKLTDADLFNLKKFTTERICALFGIPSTILGLNNDTKFNNMSLLMDSYYKSSLYPLLLNIQEQMMKSLCPDTNLCIEFCTEHLLKGSIREQVEVASMAVKSGIWTQNEARCFVDKSEMEGEESYNALQMNGTSPQDKADAMAMSSKQSTGGGGGGNNNPQGNN